MLHYKNIKISSKYWKFVRLALVGNSKLTKTTCALGFGARQKDTGEVYILYMLHIQSTSNGKGKSVLMSRKLSEKF